MSQVWYVEKCGKRRKGVLKTCLNCSKNFVARKNYGRRPSVYCGLDCRSKGSRNRETLICEWCDSSFEIKRSAKKNSKSGLRFCSRKCKDVAQRIGGIQEIMPPHYGTAKVPDYRSLFEAEEFVCNRCGYKEFQSSVDIHHMDGDRTNNSRSNLLPLCACCHKALHNGKWNLGPVA